MGQLYLIPIFQALLLLWCLNLTTASYPILGICEFGKFGGGGGGQFNDENQMANGEVTGFTIKANENKVIG